MQALPEGKLSVDDELETRIVGVHVDAVAVGLKLPQGTPEMAAGGLDEFIGEDRLRGQLLGEDVLVDIRSERPDWVLLDAHHLEEKEKTWY